MKKPKTVKQFLKQARDIIEKNGHCKGTLKDAQGRHCILGALAKVNAPHMYQDARFELNMCLSPKFKNHGLAGYNDSPGIRKANVIGLFNRAIKKFEVK